MAAGKTKDNLSSLCRRFLTSALFSGVILGGGLVFRFKHYFENRSLWLDEACFAVTVVSRSWEEIWRNVRLAPDFAGAPLFFSLGEKLAIQVVGNSELSLRFFPLCAAVFSLGLFFLYIKKVVSPLAFPLALLLFSCTDSFVYYAAEVKQYSGDVLVALILYGWTERFPLFRFSWGRVMGWAMLGAVVLWISYASFFVLSALAMTWVVSACLKREGERLVVVLGILFFWLVSFVILYKHSLSGPSSDPTLLASWRNSFLSIPFWTVNGFQQLKAIIWSFWLNPVGMVFPFWGFCLFVVGVIQVGRFNIERGAVLLLPILLALLAAMLQKYPFRERMVLFLVPAALIFLAEGAAFCIRQSGKFRWLTAVILSGILLIPSLKTSFYFLQHSREKEENRVVMQYLKTNIRKGDNLVLNNEGQYQFWYYVMSLGVEYRVGELAPAVVNHRLVLGYKVGQFLDFLAQEKNVPLALFRYNLHVYNQQGIFRQLLNGGDKLEHVYRVYPHTSIDFIKGQRVWFVFSHMDPGAQSFVLWKLDRQAQKVQEFVRQGAAAYLYDLGP